MFHQKAKTIASQVCSLIEMDNDLRKILPDVGTLLETSSRYAHSPLTWDEYKKAMDELFSISVFHDCSMEDFIAWQMRLQHRLASVTEGRLLIHTSLGNLGFIRQAADTSGEIWVLSGGRVPYILRPRPNGTYQFVEEAYIGGIMFGERWPLNDAELTEIILE